MRNPLYLLRKNIPAAVSLIVAVIIIPAASLTVYNLNTFPVKTGSLITGSTDPESLGESRETTEVPSEPVTKASETTLIPDFTAQVSESGTPASSAKPASKPPKVSSAPASSLPAVSMADWLSTPKTGADGYVSAITVGTKTMNGHQFRQQLGTGYIRSADFTYSIKGNDFIFNTKGYGHGVGMSQWGAYYYASNDGWSHEQILKHYFQGISLVSNQNASEDYVYALAQLVDLEMGASFPVEALKAQAIAVHSYLLYNQKTPSRTTRVVGDKVLNAVATVKNTIAVYNGSVISAQYFSSSNGKTRNSQDVWGGYLPYLISVESKYDYLSTGWQKDCVVPASVVKEKFGL